MKNIFSNRNFTLGILGGGQLGKMLLTETRKYDITTKVLDPSADAPGRMASNHFEVGDLKDYDTVMNFGRDVDTLTIEIEAVNVNALEDLEKSGVKVYPQPSVLRIIQNKVRQKKFYEENQIPTSPFKVFETANDLKRAFSEGAFELPFVWKAAEGGYDGFGVHIVKTEEDIEKLGGGECLVEELVPFEKELSVIVARTPSGDVQTYPVVEMEFHPTANQVEFVICPSNISSSIEEKAQEIAKKTADAFGIAGLMAVEMFLTQEGDILVNEVAPRTHNSGHLTIESNYTSQFEQHLRSVLDLPLGSTRIKCPAVMANVVGADGFTGDVVYKGYDDLLGMEGVNIHIYGKKETRPFRKMGHVTVVGPTLDEAREMAKIAKQHLIVESKQ